MLPTRPTFAPLVMLLAACLAGGCGSDDDSPATATAVTTTSTTTGTADTTSTEATGTDELTSTDVVPGEGIGLVHLDMPRAQLDDAMGKPQSETELDGGELGHASVELTYEDLTVRTSVEDQHRVISIETADNRYATGEGVTVGSSMSEVQLAYPDARCDATGDIRICRIGTDADLNVPVTDFFVEADAVTRISIGYIQD